MKLIKKDITRLDNFNVLGTNNEPDEHYDKRRTVVESNSYVLQSSDEEISDIETIYNNYLDVFTDYIQWRYHLIYLISTKGWSNLTTQEKDICIYIQGRDTNLDLSTNDTNKVTYLIGNGKTQSEAELLLVVIYSEFHTEEKESYRKRVDSERINQVFLEYLSIPDVVDFIKTTETLSSLLVNRAIVGTSYGSSSVGWMDFVESTTGTVYENAGLAAKSYSLKNSQLLSDFISDIQEVIINGNY
jgi:hypothetical protein